MPAIRCANDWHANCFEKVRKEQRNENQDECESRNTTRPVLSRATKQGDDKAKRRIMEPTNGTKPVPLHSDKIVRRLDEFPELLLAQARGGTMNQVTCVKSLRRDADVMQRWLSTCIPGHPVALFASCRSCG